MIDEIQGVVTEIIKEIPVVVKDESFALVERDEVQVELVVIENDTYVDVTDEQPPPISLEVGIQGPPGVSSGKVFYTEFSISDWEMDGNLYKMEINHPLESNKIRFQMSENKRLVFPYLFEIKGDEKIVFWICSKPDCRFDGELLLNS